MPGPKGGVGKSPHLASILDRYRQTWAESSFFWNAWQEMLGKVVSMPSSSRLLICRLATDARGGLSGDCLQIGLPVGSYSPASTLSCGLFCVRPPAFPHWRTEPEQLLSGEFPR